MDDTRYELEGACPSGGQRDLRLAYIDEESGNVYEMHDETLECTGAGLVESDVECSVWNPGSLSMSWLGLLCRLVLP